MPDGNTHVSPRRPQGSMPALTTLADALAAILAGAVPVSGNEVLPVAASLGRILAAAPPAARNLPPFDQAAMDGYALHPDDLTAQGPLPVVRHIAAGDAAGSALAAGQALRVLTGAALPAGVAAVVMQEQVQERGGAIGLGSAVPPGENLRRMGEDVQAGQALLRAGTRIDPRHIALLAAAGVAQLAVAPPLRVAVLSNGNELGADVCDSNRPMLLAMLAAPGIACTDLGVVPDQPARLAAVLRDAAADNDLILSSGGVSGSEADCLPAAARLAGGQITRLKLAVKPGKPLAFGRIGAAHCLFLPGNPLAALVAMLTLGRPLVARLSGQYPLPMARPLAGRVGEAFRRNPGREEFVPARIMEHDAFGAPVLCAAGPCGSARLQPLASAHGLMRLPAGLAELRGGDPVDFYPFHTAFSL